MYFPWDKYLQLARTRLFFGEEILMAVRFFTHGWVAWWKPAASANRNDRKVSIPICICIYNMYTNIIYIYVYIYTYTYIYIYIIIYLDTHVFFSISWLDFPLPFQTDLLLEGGCSVKASPCGASGWRCHVVQLVFLRLSWRWFVMYYIW